MHGGSTTLVSSRCTSGRKTGSRLASQDARRTNYFSVFKVYIWQKDRISSHFTRCTEDQRLYCLQGVHLAERLSLHKLHGGPTTVLQGVHLAERQDLVSLPKIHGRPTTCVFKVYIWRKTGSLLTSQDARRTNVFSVFKAYSWQKDGITSYFIRCTEDQRL